MKKFKSPTLQEIESYVREKSLLVDPVFFLNFFEAGNWHDSKGKAVKSWKQKLWTWHRANVQHGQHRRCSYGSCEALGVYPVGEDRDGHVYYRCIDHKPAPSPQMNKMAVLTEPIGKIPPEKKPESVYKQRKKLGL